MKKIISLIMAATMMVGGSSIALADAAKADLTDITAANGIITLENNAQIDLDGDGTADSVSYDLEADEYGDGKYTLTVNDASVTIDVMSGVNGLYAGRLKGDNDVIYLLVGEYGPSDDEYSYICRYEAGKLTQIGGIGALPENIAINGNVLTANVRADKFQTWFRESDFVVASSWYFDADGNLAAPEYYIAESPRTSYALATAVTLKKDVTARTSLFGEGTIELKAGEKAVITASDDRSYIYVSVLDKQAHDGADGGYIMLGASNDGVIVNGEEISSGDVFDGLVFAD